MPRCIHCGSSNGKNKFFCEFCGSYLRHREEGNKFCYNCGIRVSPYQSKCHVCYAPLDIIAEAV